MRDSRMPRVFTLLVLLLVTMACSKSGNTTSETQPVNETPSTTASGQTQPNRTLTLAGDAVCATGNKSKSKPIICVSAALAADPPTQYAWDFQKDKDGKKSKRPVKVIWLAEDPAMDIEVKITTPECIDKVDIECDKDEGECRGRIKDIVWNGKTEFPCKYTVTTPKSLPPAPAPTTGTVAPNENATEYDLIVNPCCT